MTWDEIYSRTVVLKLKFKMVHISNNLYGSEDTVFWKTVLDDLISGCNVDTALVLKMHVKRLNEIIL